MTYHDDAIEGKKALTLIIIINVVVFGFFLLQPQNPLYGDLALSAPGIQKLQLWELITYMFLHGGFFHIFFNMYTLYIFGGAVAEELGRAKFLMLYFVSGIVGGALWLSANWHSEIPVVGASGAIFGVMLAMAMLNPNREYMMLFFPVPIKCKTLIIVFAVIEVLSEYGNSGNIAHLAHLGGFVGAYFYLKLFCSRVLSWDPLDLFFAPSKPRPGAPPPGWEIHNPPNNHYNPKDIDYQSYRQDPPVSRQEIDRILDKLSQQGINSLTADETATLKKAREQLKRQH